jgi:tetratricopeptide (TPR) repeat protein
MDRSSIGPAPPNAVAEEQFRKGFEFAKAGDLDEAILNVEAALAVSPEESRYHDLLGTLYAKKGLYEMAVAEWKRSIECDPAHAEVFRRIDTAQKMRHQPDPRASQWNWMAIGLLAVGFVAAVAFSTYKGRSTRAQSDRFAALEEQAANIDRDYVPVAKFKDANTEIQSLNKAVAIKDASLAELSQKVQEFESSGKYIAKTELDKERETLNRIRSELAAERIERQRLETERAALENASGVETMAAELARKEKRIQALSSEYESMNQERNRLEREQADKNLQLTKLRDHVETLEKQVTTLFSATEGERLKAENRMLQQQLASASVGAGTGTALAVGESAQVSLLLNETLEAVEFVLDGNKDRAVAVLKNIEAKAPPGTDIGKTIDRLSPGEQVVEAPKPPEPTATPQPQPPEKKPEPKPTATPRPKPRPTQAVVIAPPPSRPPGDPGVAKPRPIPGQEPQISTAPPPQPREPRGPSAEEQRIQRLQAEKKRHADQALGLYKQRRFDEARAAVERGLRIDPSDPRLNQIRDAIQKAQGG